MVSRGANKYVTFKPDFGMLTGAFNLWNKVKVREAHRFLSAFGTFRQCIRAPHRGYLELD